MTYTWSDWQGATRCTDGPEPGARALLAWLEETFDQGSSLGIYNCRSVRGGSTTSTHGEGRAVDWGYPGSCHPQGDEVLKALGPHGRRLGIQAVIWCRTIYSQKSPDGRRYTGAAPHNDHLHIELTRAAGRNLTLATIRSVVGDSPPPQKTKEWFDMPIPDEDLHRISKAVWGGTGHGGIDLPHARTENKTAPWQWLARLVKTQSTSRGELVDALDEALSEQGVAGADAEAIVDALADRLAE